MCWLLSWCVFWSGSDHKHSFQSWNCDQGHCSPVAASSGVLVLLTLELRPRTSTRIQVWAMPQGPAPQCQQGDPCNLFLTGCLTPSLSVGWRVQKLPLPPLIQLTLRPTAGLLSHSLLWTVLHFHPSATDLSYWPKFVLDWQIISPHLFVPSVAAEFVLRHYLTFFGGACWRAQMSLLPFLCHLGSTPCPHPLSNQFV